MKRFIYILWAFILMFALVGATVSNAEELTDEVEETVEVAPPTDEVVEAPVVEDEHETVFTRLYEWFTSAKSDVYTLGGSAALFVLSIILKKDMGASAKKTIDGISRVLSKADVSDEKQTAIVNGLNEMVDGYNEIKHESAEVKACIDDVTKRITEVTSSNVALEEKIDNIFNVLVSLMDKEIMQNSAVMELLSTVYTNAALPQGIKDIVVLKQSKVEKAALEAAEIINGDEGGVTNE